MFTAALLTTTKTWKQPKRPLIGKWIKKMWRIYTMEYCSALEILPFMKTQINFKGSMLSKMKSDRRIPYNLTYMWNPKNP